MNSNYWFAIACVVGATAFPAIAQDKPTDKDVIVIPKADYQRLIDDNAHLKEEMQEMKAFKARFEASEKKAATVQAETDQAFEEVDKEIKSVKQMAKDSFPGSTKLLLTGYGSAGFIAQDHGGARQFNATFNPIFLWKLSDRLLFEGELEAELEGHDTSLSLELAQISYVVNDYITLGAGKFLNPMNYFVERQHMSWVNKLPDKPLAVYDGLLAETDVGFQVRGGTPLGSTKIGYAVFAANAPELRMDPASVAASDLGSLEFNNFDNVGRHIAVGARVGFFPIPELEFGYGFQVADVAPPGYGHSIDSLLQSVDLSYVRESARLKGILNLKAQWIWSHIDAYPYVADASAEGPLLFNNSRNGGYAQISYRPTQVENRILKNLEGIFRFDLINQARTPNGVNEHRATVGLDYWLGSSTVVKIAYAFDAQSGPEADRHNAVLLQFVTGF